MDTTVPYAKMEEDAPPQYNDITTPQPYYSAVGPPVAPSPMDNAPPQYTNTAASQPYPPAAPAPMNNYGIPGVEAQPQFSNLGLPPPYPSAEGPPVITSQVYAAPTAGWQPGIQNPLYGAPTGGWQAGMPVGSMPVGQVVYVQAPVIPEEDAPDNMCLAISSFILCCWPIGLAAIMKANACRTARQNGDRGNAIKYGNDAKRLSLFAFACGIIILVLFTLSRFLFI